MSAGRKKAYFSWSSGKDSAYALHELRKNPDYEVVGVLTTVTSDYARVSMHGVRMSLLDAQLRELGLRCLKIEIPKDCSNEVYEKEMREALLSISAEGVRYVGFGDLYLEDLKRYREQSLSEINFEGIFPLWERETYGLAKEMISSGLKAQVVCLDPKKLDRSFAGRQFNDAFLSDLPGSVDPCGENGEFHTFAFDGPMFRSPIAVVAGAVVERNGFVFADLKSTSRLGEVSQR